MTRDETAPKAPHGYTLLTGATGLLGRYLLRDLLQGGQKVALLLRPSKDRTAEDRVDAVLATWARLGHPALPRPVVFSGDVAIDGLGLRAADRRWVETHCTRLVHGAAVLKFHGLSRDAEPWRTNLQGAKHVFTLCRELGIEDLHHVSTAYVSGDREGTVLESELDAGQGFRNDYEESKCLAEMALREEEAIPHRTVYRPGVIAGDAHTGYTSTYHGLYVYMRSLSILMARIEPDADGVRRIPYAAPLPLEEPRNIIPVDWVSRVIVRLLETPAARGHVYHLTPTDRVTPRDLLDYASAWYGGSRVDLCHPSRWNGSLQRVSRAVGMVRSYESYGATEPTFDTSNVARFAADLPCPRLDEATIHRYLEYAERDGWGRRTSATP